MKTAFYRFLVFGVLFFFSSSFLTAQNQNDSVYITSLSITGLKRTRLSTAEQPLKKFIGQRTDQVNMDEVQAAVMAGGILESISAEIRGQVLCIEVREKWSIFPVPVFFAGSDRMMGGLAFFDANAFGLNDKFFVAGIFHSDGWAASTGYIHNSPGEHRPGWSGMATFSREERNDRNQNNHVLRRFEHDSISLGAGLSFPLLKNNDMLSVSTRFSFNQKNLREKKKSMNGPDEDLRLYGAGTELSARKSTWDGYLLSQESASLAYTFRTSFENFSYHSIRFRGIWEKSLIPGFRINLRTGLVYDPDAPILFESSPYSAQVSILPADFSAKNYAGFSAGLEKYIFKIPSGTLSLALAYQIVYSQGSLLEDSFDHGFTGMMFFYLSRLAIPALGFGAAYNVKENYLQGSFALGMSF